MATVPALRGKKSILLEFCLPFDGGFDAAMGILGWDMKWAIASDENKIWDRHKGLVICFTYFLYRDV